MSDLPDHKVSPNGDESQECPACHSADIRPSRGSYPHDREQLGAGGGRFWRCNYCGNRFPGLLAPTERHRRRRHNRGAARDLLDESIFSSRMAKRWLFPILVILATILAVTYILDRRDRPPEQIVLPG